jgi:L-ribulose-5-phosphate 4-epimerase
MKAQDIASEYEKNTGEEIVRSFAHVSYEDVPAVLVANHGPFAWGATPEAAVHHAVVLEAVARTAYFTTTLNHEAQAIGRPLHDKHYLRKHGSNAYYGQPKEKR